MVIDTEFGWEDHGSVPRNYDRRRLEPLDARTDSRIWLGGPLGRMLVAKKIKINKSLILSIFQISLCFC
jgi:hypothetical protein